MADKILVRLRSRSHPEMVTDPIQIDMSLGSVHLQEILKTTHGISTQCLFFVGAHKVSDSLAKLTELINQDIEQILEQIIVIDYINPSEIIEDSKLVMDEHIEQILVFKDEVYVLLYGGDLAKLIYADKKIIKINSGISRIGAGERLLGVKNNCVMDIKTGEEFNDDACKELDILQLSVSKYGYAVAYSDKSIVIYDYNGIVVDSVHCVESCRMIKLVEMNSEQDKSINKRDDNSEHNKRNYEFREKLLWIDKLDLLMEYNITKKKIIQTFTNTVLVNFCVDNKVIYACTSENRLVEIRKNNSTTYDVCVRLVDALEPLEDTLLMFTQFEVLSYDVKKHMETNCLRVKEQITSYALFGDKLLISAENVIYGFNTFRLVNEYAN